MQILHVCGSRSFSGLEAYAFQMAHEQLKTGFKVAFMVTKGSRLESECTRVGIETIPFDPYSFLGTMRFWPTLTALFLKNSDLKVLHLHSTQEVFHILGARLFSAALKKRNAKIILQVHIWIKHKRQDPWHGLTYSIVDELWCSSQPARASVLKTLPIPAEKIRIVPYGRNVDQIAREFLSRPDARKALQLPDDSITIGLVARLEENKGVWELLNASLPLIESRKDLHVVVIGGEDKSSNHSLAYKQKIDEWLSSINPESRKKIHMMGMMPESHKYLRAFDLYVLPSYIECFSLALLDAQLAGLPVLGTNTGGTPEVVIEGKTGWLFEPQDVIGLTQKLEEALGQQINWPKYGQAAKDRVQKDYRFSDVMKDITKAYGI